MTREHFPDNYAESDGLDVEQLTDQDRERLVEAEDLKRGIATELERIGEISGQSTSLEELRATKGALAGYASLLMSLRGVVDKSKPERSRK